MANIGNETPSGSSGIGTEDGTRTLVWTMPETGDITSVSVHMGESSASNAHSCKGIIYDSSGNILGETATRQDIVGGGYDWYQFDFSPAVTVTGSTVISFGITIGSGSGNLLMHYVVGGSSGDSKYASFPGQYPTIPDPTTLTDDTYDLTIYATYTPGGDPEGSLIQGKLLRGGLLLGGVLTR
jgi:hypothetical protein